MTVKRSLLILITFILTTTLSFGQKLNKEKALEDFNEFKTLLEKQSSYYQISDTDFNKLYEETERKIKSKDSIRTYFLAFELEKIISELIDRHASIKMEDFEEDDYNIFGLHFPFSLGHLKGKVVALNHNRSKNKYEYYSKDFPFLKSINNIDIYEFIDKYAYTNKRSPSRAKLNDGLQGIRDIGELYFKQGKTTLEEISITLTDGEKTKNIVLPPSSKRHMWFDIGSLWMKRDYSDFRKEKNYDLSKLDKWLTDSIAYLAIPIMVSYENNPNLEAYLKFTMEKYRNSKALIIDIRSNGGGTRDILKTISKYLVKPEQSPWIANVAYVRSDQYLDEDISSMQSRYLYNYNSEFLSENDRKAIDTFNSQFKTEYSVSNDKFSEPFYMVLQTNNLPLKCPVYILVNEMSFSAASVFTSAFKGLPNVKIVGVNTNGSSGRSQYFYLKNSNIRVKLSTMLSFQRNGQPLDGRGTKPDIIIEKDEAQIFAKEDSQLKKLIHIIETSKH